MNNRDFLDCWGHGELVEVSFSLVHGIYEMKLRAEDGMNHIKA